MTDKRLRPGGGRGVISRGSERIGHDRKSRRGKGLGIPASVPGKFTILVDIHGGPVFPGGVSPVHGPPSPSIPCPFVHCSPVHYTSQRKEKPRPDGFRPGLGCWPTRERYAIRSALLPPSIPFRPLPSREPLPSASGRDGRPSGACAREWPWSPSQPLRHPFQRHPF